MDLTVLGAGPAYSDRPGALGSSYLLQASGGSIVLDFGQGVFPSLAAAIEPSSVDGVVISHLHPDHCIDLVPLRHYLCYEFRPSRRVSVLAPRALPERIDALHGELGFTRESLDVDPIDGTPRTLGPFSIVPGRVTHTDDSWAFRIVAPGDGPALVYSGDCGRALDLEPLIRPGDTLLTEVSFGPGPVPVDEMHLDGRQIAELASRTSPGRILLTHLQMGYDPDRTIDAVRAGFDGPLQFVAPGDHLTI